MGQAMGQAGDNTIVIRYELISGALIVFYVYLFNIIHNMN